ncbi:MAG: YdcF family protein [Epsilonproteobacteria bacterium]|nr:YdcF family protein [Campylobacterota bacterium]
MISLHPVADLLIKSLEYRSYPIPHSPPQAVVVLGGGDIPQAPNLPTSPAGTKRILYGLMLAYQDHLPLIVSGKENESAKATILQISEAFGLPFKESSTPKPLHFTIEGVSQDTFQNAAKSATLAPKSIYLVTSAFHMPRSYRLFRHFGFEVRAAPTDYRGWSQYEPLDILPSMGAMWKSYWAMHEYLGLLSLYLRGIF